jgi:hypothetical protein
MSENVKHIRYGLISNGVIQWEMWKKKESKWKKKESKWKKKESKWKKKESKWKKCVKNL